MTETIEEKIRKSRKQHICDYCGKPIEKNTLYRWSKCIYDGGFFEWRSHLACAHIASAIWDYVEPDEGMHSDEFRDGCQEVCQSFICPDCPKWDAEEYEGCVDDKSYCLDKMEQFFGTHELYMAGRDGFAHVWKVREKQPREYVYRISTCATNDRGIYTHPVDIMEKCGFDILRKDCQEMMNLYWFKTANKVDNIPDYIVQVTDYKKIPTAVKMNLEIFT